jgi:hypothetical protein
LPQDFSLAPQRCAVLTDPALRTELENKTGSADSAAGILRSISRFGNLDGILRFEMTPRAGTRNAHTNTATAWTVRAVRADSPPPPAESY